MAVAQQDQTLVAFAIENGGAAKRLLESLEKVDAVDDNVKIVDAATVEHTKRGRIKVHQTEDMGAMKGGFHGAAIGVVVGAIVAGPAGAVAGGAAGGLLHSLRSRFHDIGIDDKFMKAISKEIDRGQSALFVQYEGNWAASIGLIENAIKAESALLFSSTLPAEKAAALRALVEPAAEVLGGDEVVADYEVQIEEVPEEAAPAEAAPAEAAPAEAAPAAAAAVAASDAGNGHAAGDDLTQLVGIGPKAATALVAAGITSYAALAETNEPQLRHALHEADMMPPGNVGTWPMQASYAAKGDWMGLMKHNEKATAKAKPAAASAGAKAAAAPPDDLTQINGIGPRIEAILNEGGITTFAELQRANSGDLRQIIAVGGALPPSSLDSWPTQATYAARGDWQGLATYNRH